MITNEKQFNETFKASDFTALWSKIKRRYSVQAIQPVDTNADITTCHLIGVSQFGSAWTCYSWGVINDFEQVLDLIDRKVESEHGAGFEIELFDHKGEIWRLCRQGLKPCPWGERIVAD